MQYNCILRVWTCFLTPPSYQRIKNFYTGFQQVEKYKAKGSSSVRLCPICQNGVSTTFSTNRWVLLLSAIERYDREKCSRYLQNVHSMRRKFSTGPKS